MLGKFEELVLLALLQAGSKVPASKVYEALTKRADNAKSFGAMYTTLDRMAEKKFISETKIENVGPRRRSRRYFTISALGESELTASMNQTREMASGLSIPGLIPEAPR